MYLDETRFGPLLKLLLGGALVVAFALVVLLILTPLATAWLRGTPVSYPWERKEALPAAPAFVPEAGTPIDTDGAEAAVLADPSLFDGKLLFAAGDAPEGCDRLLRLDPAAGAWENIPVTLANDTIRYPVEDGERILYLDAKTGGGGAVRLLTKATGEATTLCTLASGAPVLCYEAPYLALTVPGANGKSHVAVYDVTTGEGITLALVDTVPYGASGPCLRSGQVLFADGDPNSPELSLLRTVLPENGTAFDLAAGTYVHDPKSNGDCWAWLDSDHGPAGGLYLSRQGGEPRQIARGATDFFITSAWVLYGRDGSVFAYSLADDTTRVLSPGSRICQPVCAGEDGVLWQDVTAGETPRLYYCKLR